MIQELLFITQGESKSVSAYEKTAEELPETLDKAIVEENYMPETILNMDEASLPTRISPIIRPSQCHSSRLFRTG